MPRGLRCVIFSPALLQCPNTASDCNPSILLRESVLDTETTGLDPVQGRRLVELGCVELLNRIPTGSTFHVYLNPERDVPAEAFAIHGLSSEFLQVHKRFIDIADEF